MSVAWQKRGRIWSIEPDRDGEDPKVVAHVGGTLLGGAFDKEGGMYIADATRGLLYIAAEDLGKPGKTRIVASLAPPANLQSASSNETLDQTEIRYANDVAVDPTTGNVYFTDSTRIAPRVTSARLGDTLLSFGDSALTGDATGRLLMYSPTSGETHVLVTGIPFANGVGVMKGGSHILFVSTTTYSVYKVPVPPADEKDIGPSAKLSETDRFYAGTLAGMPDGLTVDRKDGSVWVPMFVPVLPILRFANVAPKWVRRILVSAPAFLRPGAKSVHAIIAQFDADGVLLRVLHDKQRQFGMLASVARCGKFLFCGCLSGHHVAQFDLT